MRSHETLADMAENWRSRIRARTGWITAATVAVVIAGAGGWHHWRESPLSEDQQITLTAHVCLIARNQKTRPQAVWSKLKKPFGVASYKDFRRKHWPEAREWTLSRLRARH